MLLSIEDSVPTDLAIESHDELEFCAFEILHEKEIHILFLRMFFWLCIGG